MGNLEIFQEFVNSITECLRDFLDSNVSNKVYLLFIFVNRRSAREKEWGGGFCKIGHFYKHHKCMSPNEVNVNESVL